MTQTLWDAYLAGYLAGRDYLPATPAGLTAEDVAEVRSHYQEWRGVPAPSAPAGVDEIAAGDVVAVNVDAAVGAAMARAMQAALAVQMRRAADDGAAGHSLR